MDELQDGIEGSAVRRLEVAQQRVQHPDYPDEIARFPASNGQAADTLSRMHPTRGLPGNGP